MTPAPEHDTSLDPTGIVEHPDPFLAELRLVRQLMARTVQLLTEINDRAAAEPMPDLASMVGAVRSSMGR